MTLSEEKEKLAKYIASQVETLYLLQCEVNVVVFGMNITLSVIARCGTMYYAKIYRTNGKSKSDISLEIQCLNLMDDTKNLIVSRPVRNILNQYISDVCIPGYANQSMVLFSAIKGRAVKCDPFDFDLLGRAVRDIHLQNRASVRPELVPPDLINIELRLKSLDGLQCTNICQILSLLSLFSFRKKDIPVDNVLLHGDIHKTNIKIHDSRAGFFDFDDGGVGCLYYDIAAVVIWIENTTCDYPSDTWASFINAYGKCESHISRDQINFFSAIRQIMSLLFLGENNLIGVADLKKVVDDIEQFMIKADKGSLKVYT